MIYKQLRAVIAIFAGCLLISCHSELQLDNLDPTMEAQIKMALPLGTIHAKVSDFIKSNDSMHLEISPDGTYTWKMTFNRASKFDHFDLGSKLQNANFKVNLYKQLEGKTFHNPLTGEDVPILNTLEMLGITQIVLPYGCEFKDKFTFNMPMELNGVNDGGSNRVDSAFLPEASFKITITKDNFDGLDWDWIESVKLDLGNYIIRRDDESSEVILYKKDPKNPVSDLESLTWNMDLGAVRLNLMDDPDGTPGDDNVLDKISFPVEIAYEIPAGKSILEPTTVNIDKNSGIECDFQKKELEIAAIWGFFKQTQGQKASDTINISAQLDSVPFLKEAKFPIKEPRIDATIKTNAAGDIKLNGSIAALDKGSVTPRYATFKDDLPFFDWAFKGMNPSKSNFNDSSVISLHFSNNPDSGHIDNLFSKMPEKLAFDVEFQFNKKTTPQIRLVNDMYFNMNATATVPFTFKEGFEFNFTDTMPGVAISQLQVDSLLSSVPAIDSAKVNEATLVMTIFDSIPLDLKVSFYCLKKDGSIVMDPEDNSKKFTIFPTDTIVIPTELYTAQDRQPITCKLNQARMNVLPEIGSIVYSIQAKAPEGKETVIRGSNSLYIKMGITADLNAYISPKGNTNGNNK